MFTTTQTTPLTHGSSLYHRFIWCCQGAGIETLTTGADDREVEHVDLHSLRRTFATNLIVNGADPKSVQTLLGHKTLEMTMSLYAKIRAGTKRQALARLSFGGGVRGSEHVVEFPERRSDGHNLVTSGRKAVGG